MKPTTKIALAGLLSAAGNLLNAFATEFGAEAPASPEAAATPEAPKTRGRKPAAAAAPAQPEAPAESETPAAPAESTEGAKTYEELKALIKPLVEGGQGADVKKVIRKYAGEDGTLKTLETKPEHHAAFEKDLAALAY